MSSTAILTEIKSDSLQYLASTEFLSVQFTNFVGKLYEKNFLLSQDGNFRLSLYSMLNRGFWTNFLISGLLCSDSTGSPSNARANTRPSKQSERRKFPSRESRQFFSGNLPTKFVNWLHVTTSTSAWWCQIAIFFAFCAKRRDESSKTNPIDSGKAWRDSPWETQISQWVDINWLIQGRASASEAPPWLI